MQEAAATAQRQARHPESAPLSGGQASGGTKPAAPAAAGPAAKLPTEELELLVVLAKYPELIGTSDAARGGDLLVHPLARQLNRAAVEHSAEGGKTPRSLDVPAWLETVAVADRATIATALRDERFAGLADPPGYLRKLVFRLEILRVDAEISMNTRLQREAQARGDDEQLRALAVRGIELRKTKEGLLAALQRP